MAAKCNLYLAILIAKMPSIDCIFLKLNVLKVSPPAFFVWLIMIEGYFLTFVEVKKNRNNVGEAMPLIKRVAKQIQKYDLIGEGETVVAAVSGGPDSVALLHVLYRLREQFGFKLVAAHLNHGFRGAEAEADAVFVEEFARRLNLASYIETRNVPEYGARMGLSAQVAAREIRYSFLSEVALRTGAAKVALGHHADDQAETILLHLLRGAGPGGLAGMQPIRDKFYIRPLLNVKRRDIEAYCSRHNLAVRQDSSNLKCKYLRNRIRLELIPTLEKNYNPNLTDALNRLGRICREEDEYLEKQSDAVFYRVISGSNGHSVTLDRDKLLDQPAALLRRVIRRAWFEICGSNDELGFGHIEQIMEIIKGGGGYQQVDLPKGVTCKKNYGLLEFTLDGEEKEVPFYQHHLKVPGITAVPEAGLSIGARILPAAEAGDPASLGPDEVLLDYDCLSMPLVARRRMEGDRFTPLGLEGSMKLKKFFIDHKVPRHLRNHLPLVVSGSDIVWVTGMRPGHRSKVTEDTINCLHLFIYDYWESFCDKLIRRSNPDENPYC